MKHNIKEWILATRPWSFPASAMPVLVTFAYMIHISKLHGIPVDILNGILSIIGIVFFHAAGNVMSDYMDYKKGVDKESNRPYMPLVNRTFTPSEYLRLSTTLFIAGCIVGFAIMYRCGWPLIIAGAAGALFAATYSTFKYNALGDLVIFGSYSIIPIMGTTYAVSSTYYYPALVLALPVGLITVAILHVNNTRDADDDRKAGIHTFAMLIGEEASLKLYAAEVLAPFALLAISVILGWLPLYSIVTLLAMPQAWKCARIMLAAKEKGLGSIAPLDEATAKLQSIFSILLTISLLMDTYL